MRGGPGVVRHGQRTPGDAGLPHARAAHRHPAGRPGRRTRRQADHLRRHSGRPDPGHHLAGVVRFGERRPPVLAVHDQHRAPQAVAHAHRQAALLSRPRLDRRTRRAAAGVPTTAGHDRAVHRTAHRRRLRARPRGALPDTPLEVVDPLRVSGQPVHAQPVPRWADHLAVHCGRGQDRRGGQRLDRGGQPQRRGGRPRRRLPPHAGGHGVHVSRPGPAHRRAAQRDIGQARWHPQRADQVAEQTVAPDRRLRAAVVRVQLPRTDRQPTRRGHHHSSPRPGSAILRRVMAQMAMVMNLDKCIGCHTCSVTCKQAWTNRSGVEYVWFNNVETRPGQGYPRRYEDQERWRGGWELTKRGKLRLKGGGRVRKLLTIFANPKLPGIDEYYEPWTYDYESLTNAPLQEHSPVARPKSLIRKGKDTKITWSANWDDDLGGSAEHGEQDPIVQKIGDKVRFEFERTFMFYLPRICEHCLNPSCAASCPSGAIYKRSEDGIVLVDQDRCRGWRMCVSGCPYKKVYFNHRTGKAEKCTFCFPRVEVGLP